MEQIYNKKAPPERGNGSGVGGSLCLGHKERFVRGVSEPEQGCPKLGQTQEYTSNSRAVFYPSDFP